MEDQIDQTKVEQPEVQAEKEIEGLTIENVKEAKPKKMSKSAKVMCKVVGVILLLLAVLFFFSGVDSFSDKEEHEADPIPVTEVTKEDVYVSDEMTYLTDYFASFTANENRRFYMAVHDRGDGDYHLTIVCIDADDSEQYSAYIDFAYDSTSPDPGPMTLLGQSKKVDDTLKEMAIGLINTFYGIEITDEEYENNVLPYYIMVDNASGSYSGVTTGLILIVLAGISLFISLSLLTKNDKDETGQGSLILGIIGAILGVSVGGVIWTIVGMAGYICSWVGIVMILLAIKGYTMFCKKQPIFGIIFGFVLSVIMVLVADFAVGTLEIFESLNDGTYGFVSLSDTISRSVKFFFGGEGTKSFVKNAIFGELFVVICGGSFLSRARKKNTEE